MPKTKNCFEAERRKGLSLLVLAMLAVVFLVSCTRAPSAIPDLLCRVTVELQTTTDCTGVPSLADAELRLAKRGTFVLTGHYDACYQVEEVRIEGSHHAAAHPNGVDLELLAERTTGGVPETRKLKRTIGLVNLDIETLKGRFTDTAFLIRSRGQMEGSAPSLPMTCSRQ